MEHQNEANKTSVIGAIVAPPFVVMAAIPIVDRHRGGGHPPTPATPPCVRVRARRFESVTRAVLE
jgi:hypothetical protein